MLLAEEWSAYGTKKRFLRVTSPTGGQRSTYRLQLPYRYSVPLLIGSSILHWLVSQSIFLARLNTIDSAGVEISGADISTCGYSPMAMIFVIILGSIIVLLGICFGFRKSRGGMPLAGSCSAAISAACHPPEADVNASLKRVMWGVVAEDSFQYERERVLVIAPSLVPRLRHLLWENGMLGYRHKGDNSLVTHFLLHLRYISHRNSLLFTICWEWYKFYHTTFRKLHSKDLLHHQVYSRGDSIWFPRH